MPDGSQHLSDEEILQFIDHELPASRAEQLREHVAACPKCRQRRASIEGTLNTLSEFYVSEQVELGSMAARSRTLLQEQLVEDRKRHSFWRGRVAVGHLYLSIATAAIVLVFIGFAFYGGRKIWTGKPSVLSPQEEAIVPNRSLTPGAVRAVSLKEICSSTDDDLDPRVSSSTERAVLQEYGLSSNKPSLNYQIDYLVNPQLGGTNDIRNLWPEPYSDARWNAQAKDELERHLHQMVCNRTVDLAVAQQEIATDWIAAYKKYVGRNS
jgi:putative zinc finger protein